MTAWFGSDQARHDLTNRDKVGILLFAAGAGARWEMGKFTGKAVVFVAHANRISYIAVLHCLVGRDVDFLLVIETAS